MGAATFTLPALPIAIRADVMYHSFDGASTLGVDGDAKWNIIPGPLSPYAIGGLSWGSTSIEALDESESDFGWNLGGGLDFGISKLSFFAEARYLKLGDGDGIYPITLGLRF
jgi:opacity protein-like surface antigen